MHQTNDRTSPFDEVKASLHFHCLFVSLMKLKHIECSRSLYLSFMELNLDLRRSK